MYQLFLIRFRQFNNGLRTLSGGGRARLLLGVLLLLAVGAGLFWGFYRSLIFLQAFLGLGRLLVDRLLYLLTFSLFALLVFSNAAISFQLHFRARETAYLHSLPLSPGTIHRFLLLECFLLSTAAAAFFLLPSALAYGLVYGLSGRAVLLLGFFAGGLAGLATAAGSLIASLIPRLRRPGVRRWTIAAVGAIFVLVLLFRGTPPPRERLDGEPVLMINHLLEHSRITLNPAFPGYWAAEGFLAAARGRFRRSLGFLAVLAVNLLLAGEAARLIGGERYFRDWAGYRGRGGMARKKPESTRYSGRSVPRSPLPSPVRAILFKDRKNFLRDPAQWLQAAVLFGLLAVYIVNIRNMPSAVREPFWKNLVTFFNLGAASLILATLTTRFLFPAFSLEGRTFWILGLAPIRRETIFRARFWGGCAAALLVTVPLIVLSSRMLEISGEMTALTAGAAAVISAVLVSLATGLGAVFPDYGEENPARIASGFGGTLNLVISLIYIAVTVGALAGIGHLKTGPFGTAEAALARPAYFLAGAVSLAGLWIPYRLGLRALKRSEF